jgi:hypothetical protein
MKRFVVEADRGQWRLLPECLDDFIDESNPVRVVDAFIAAPDLAELGFDGVQPAATGRPAYHPSTLDRSWSCDCCRTATRASHIDPPASSNAILRRVCPTAERTLNPARMLHGRA